jgi:glutamyl-Q tRNA(Asp) synthetase
MKTQPRPSSLDPRPCLYRGRFAPSPSGDLHFGSLIAAVGSYLQARQQQGEWHVRIDDIDPPREVPGATDQILRSLEYYGFEWDGEVVYQSRRQEIYQWALETLQQQGQIYPCSCTRKSLAEHLDPKRPEVYPGLCRQGLPPGEKGRSLRVLCQQTTIQFDDRIQGLQQMDMASECGDFVVKRADGLIAYQLATAVDDAEQGMTEVVRGSDLLESTFRQRHLQQLLSLPSPIYAHLPIATNEAGDKLSKKTRSQAIVHLPVQKTLYQVLQFLGQNPPAELRRVPLQEIWSWAIENWDLAHVPHQRQIVFKNSDKN